MADLLKLQSISSSIALIATFSCLHLLSHEIQLSNAQNGGFSTDIFHRDSPKSPLFDNSLTHPQRLANCLKRSIIRARHLAHHHHQHHRLGFNRSSPIADIIPDSGEYLMRIHLGTPPVEILAIADTGSDLIWTQCKPCEQCFDQKAPLFDSGNSSTYKGVRCSDAELCIPRLGASCDPSRKLCVYSMAYGDGSFSKGIVATETLTLGGNALLENIVFGCAHHSGGSFGAGSSGIVGLGGGNGSLVSQLQSKIRGKFSYCLVDFNQNKSSAINFGDPAVVSGPGVMKTPIVSKKPITYYYLLLKGITVGSKRLELSDGSSNYSKSEEEGNIIIDSGTTLTYLPAELYQRVELEVRKHIKKKTVSDPQGFLNLCYLSLKIEEIPGITLHFKGADVKLKASNVFVETSNTSNCLAFAEAEGVSIYGNIAQMGFLVGYDLEKKTLSFKASDCGA